MRNWPGSPPAAITSFAFEMRTILHILTRPEDELTREVLAQQQPLPETKIETLDLGLPEPDYTAVVEKIFAADSVEVF